MAVEGDELKLEILLAVPQSCEYDTLVLTKVSARPGRCQPVVVGRRPSTAAQTHCIMAPKLLGATPPPPALNISFTASPFFLNQHSPPPAVVLWWSSAPRTVAHYGGSKIASLVGRQLEPITLP